MSLPSVPEPLAPSPFLDLGHERVLRRGEPRASIALAGAGCVLAFVGVLVLAADRGTDDGAHFNRWPGLVLSVVVIAVGMGLVEVVRRGPIATAGAVGAALGVPAAFLFLTFRDSSLPPYSTNVVLLGSTLAWAAAYAMGPGRGRPVFLGAAAFGVWASLLQLTEQVFDAPFHLGDVFFTGLGASRSGTIDPVTGELIPDTSSSFAPVFHAPDATTVGLVSLLVGVAFLVGSRWLDRSGRHGAATPLLVAAIPTLIVGGLTLSDDLEAVGTGLLLLVIGGALLFVGSTALRRATTWIGAAVAALGLAIVLGDATDDATIGGILFLLGGVALVALAYLYSNSTGEPDELLVVPARWRVRAEGPRRQVLAEPAAEAPPAEDAPEDWAPRRQLVADPEPTDPPADPTEP